jgi:polysaccharide biosynthesis/export protein
VSSFFCNARRSAFCVAAVALIVGCTSIPVNHLPGAKTLPLLDEVSSESDNVYRIAAGDDLDIKFFYTKEMNESVKVRPDGFISLQLVDEVKAGGLTPQELNGELTKRYAVHIKNPVLTVIVRSFPGFRAYVGGEVAVPQLVSLDGGITPLQAILRAGGARTTAHMKSVVLIRKGPRGEPISYQLDLSDGAIAEAQRDLRVALKSSDVIYVPRSPIANANLFVQQYISELFLYRGIQLGYSYTDVRSGRTSVLPLP